MKADKQAACGIVRKPDGARFCRVHDVTLQPQELIAVEGRNDPGLGKMSCWLCPVSGQSLLEPEGL